MENLLVQRITVIREDAQYALDMNLLQSLTYVETLDLSGPRLMLTLSDRENVFRDDYQIGEGTVLEIALSDQHMRGGIDVVERFVVRSVTAAQNETLLIQGFALPIHLLKTPAASAVFVNDADAPTVIKRNVPGVPVSAGMLPAMDAWHLLPGERPSRKIRQMARELGAAVYYGRGQFHAYSLRQLYAQEAFDEFHYNDPRQANQMVSYKSLYRSELANERMRRAFVGWDMTEGVIQGVRHPDAPIEIARFGQVPVLDALNVYLLPAIDFACNGWGALKPGLCINLKFHRAAEGKPYDESLPEKVLTYAVAHHYAINRYQCRVKAGVIHE